MNSDVIVHFGDCLPFMKTLESGSVDCIVTDPPYGTNFKNDIYSDSADEIDQLIPQWYSEWKRILKDNSYLFVFCGILNIDKWVGSGKNAGFDFRNILATRTFVRGGLSAKGNFCFEFQPILVFSKGKGKHFNKVNFFPQSKEWKKDKRNKHPSDFTYTYSNWIPSELAYGTETFGYVNKSDFHPNAKNVKLEQFLIEISTRENETVFDPFMGSGTTGIAATNCGRNFIGCEINENWFNRSKMRIEDSNPLFVNQILEK